MMKGKYIRKPETPDYAGISYCCILLAAGLIFAFMSFRGYVQSYYEHFLIVPCMLFVGIHLGLRGRAANKKRFILPGAMVAWYLFLQVKRFVESGVYTNFSLFLTVYLFAFPLACVMKDGNRKKILKIFAGAYLAAAILLTLFGSLLFLDRLPGIFEEHVYWEGGRLAIFWHPNITACLLMIGIILCVTFFSQGKRIWIKPLQILLLVPMLAMLALTSCRTVIILTGGYLGSIFFFMMVRHGKIWFVPGVLAVLVVTAVFYGGAVRLYQENYNMLLEKYTRQHSEYTGPVISAPPTASGGSSLTLVLLSETKVPGEMPGGAVQSCGSRNVQASVEVDPATGEVYLGTGSPQGSFFEDFGTLNRRTEIWNAAKTAIQENPSIFWWGVHNPGVYVSEYNKFSVPHMHNAWLQCFMGMGIAGFLMAMLFTIRALWNSLVILLRHHRDVWKRNVALLTLCLMAASFVESYLFYTTVSYHLPDFLFFLCTGYLVQWQEEDNRRMRSWIRRRIPFVKK